MQKGYKRESKGLAVLRCFIGLFIIAVIALTAYYLLTKDYRDRVAEGTVVRAYVEATQTPDPTPEATAAAVIITATPGPTSSPTPSPLPAVPTDTPEPVATPSPEPTIPSLIDNSATAVTDEAEVQETDPNATIPPVEGATLTLEGAAPTPEVTRVPKSAYNQVKAKGFTIPDASVKNGKVGLTYSLRSSGNDNRVVILRGYAYIDDADFDGSKATVYLTATGQSTGRKYAIRPSQGAGLSGITLGATSCTNASACDFEANVYLGQFKDDTYQLGVVLTYTDQAGREWTEYFPLEGSTLTVATKTAVSDVAVSNASSQSAGTEASSAAVTETVPEATEAPAAEAVAEEEPQAEAPTEAPAGQTTTVG